MKMKEDELKGIRYRARHAVYVVYVDESEPLLDADAAKDMLALCDAYKDALQDVDTLNYSLIQHRLEIEQLEKAAKE